MIAHRPTPTCQRLSAVGLALLLAGAPLSLVQAQTAQDSAANRMSRPSGYDQGAKPDTARASGQAAGQPTSQPTAQAAGAAASSVVADSAYVREAASLNLSEVRLGTMAAARASNADVKRFAQQMVADHRAMQQQWVTLASRNGLPTGVSLNSIQQQRASELSKVSGSTFDRAFMGAMIQDHEQYSATLQRIAAGARSDEVKRLAASGTSAMQQHLSRAEQVGSEVGVTDSTVAAVPAGRDRSEGRRLTGTDWSGRDTARYARGVAYEHILALRLAEIAQQRGKHQEVRQFARQILSDFPKWQRRWTELADAAGAPVNPNMGPEHQAKLRRVQKASGSNFDQVYVDVARANMRDLVPFVEKEGRASRSKAIRQAAKDEYPSLQKKQDALQRLDDKVLSSRH